MFFDHTPLLLENELYSSDQTINDDIVKHISDALIEFKIKLIKMNYEKNV